MTANMTDSVGNMSQTYDNGSISAKPVHCNTIANLRYNQWKTKRVWGSVLS